MPTSGSGASTSQIPGRASDFASAFTPPRCHLRHASSSVRDRYARGHDGTGRCGAARPAAGRRCGRRVVVGGPRAARRPRDGADAGGGARGRGDVRPHRLPARPPAGAASSPPSAASDAPGIVVAALLAIVSCCFLLALDHTSVAHVLLWQAISPFLAALLAWVGHARADPPAHLDGDVRGALAGVAIMVGGSLGSRQPARRRALRS